MVASKIGELERILEKDFTLSQMYQSCPELTEPVLLGETTYAQQFNELYEHSDFGNRWSQFVDFSEHMRKSSSLALYEITNEKKSLVLSDAFNSYFAILKEKESVRNKSTLYEIIGGLGGFVVTLAGIAITTYGIIKQDLITTGIGAGVSSLGYPLAMIGFAQSRYYSNKENILSQQFNGLVEVPTIQLFQRNCDALDRYVTQKLANIKKPKVASVI